MKKVVRLRVQRGLTPHQHYGRLLSGGPHYTLTTPDPCLQRLLPQIKGRKKFILEARLAPRGAFRLTRMWVQRVQGPPFGVPFCWLPPAWSGRRLSIRVRNPVGRR